MEGNQQKIREAEAVFTKTRENVNNASVVDTQVDIAAEIRRAVESMGDELPYVVSAGTMRRIADRIEAAAKRDAAIHLMTVEANERLREHLGIAIENDKRTAVGNTAAMREAAESVVESEPERKAEAVSDAVERGVESERSTPTEKPPEPKRRKPKPKAAHAPQESSEVQSGAPGEDIAPSDITALRAMLSGGK